MKLVFLPVFSNLLVAIGGCSPRGYGNSAMESDIDHLRFAELISAVDGLMFEGRLKQDPDFDAKSLVQVLSHVNAYGVTKNRPEEQAMGDVKKMRAKLLGSMKSTEIWDQAKVYLT